ncbi:hypothetical protein LCGC14_2470590, partial [marine sediment metagenome]
MLVQADGSLGDPPGTGVENTDFVYLAAEYEANFISTTRKLVVVQTIKCGLKIYNGSFNDYTENKVLDHIVGKTSFTMPTAYVGLSTADPLDDASGLAEPSGNNYARVTTSGSDWDAAASGATANAAALA